MERYVALENLEKEGTGILTWTLMVWYNRGQINGPV